MAGIDVKVCIDQKQFIDKIKDNCYTGDYERNGCELDKIIIEFLDYLGTKDLCDEVFRANMYNWRA